MQNLAALFQTASIRKKSDDPIDCSFPMQIQKKVFSLEDPIVLRFSSIVIEVFLS